MIVQIVSVNCLMTVQSTERTTTNKINFENSGVCEMVQVIQGAHTIIIIKKLIRYILGSTERGSTQYT